MPPSDQPQPLSASTPYSPPQYLLANTCLTRDDIISQYQEFCRHLRFVENAPELVFERLVGNLKEAFMQPLQQDRVRHAEAHEEWRKEKNALKLEVERLTAVVSAGKLNEKQTAAVRTYSSEVEQAPAPPVAKAPATSHASNQIYLKFWFAPSGTNIRVRAAATSTPVPYGIDSGWPESDHFNTARDRGFYDTRIDYARPDVRLPTTITRVVKFRNVYESPPAVAVWLTGFGTTRGAPVSVQATANDVTETEFTLQINSGGGSPLMSAGIAWAAFSRVTSGARSISSRSKVRTGSFSTSKPGNSKIAQLSESGSLDSDIITESNVVLAISSVNMLVGENIWLGVDQDQSFGWGKSRHQPLGWSMRAGPAETRLYSLRVSYIGTAL